MGQLRAIRMRPLSGTLALLILRSLGLFFLTHSRRFIVSFISAHGRATAIQNKNGTQLYKGER